MSNVADENELPDDFFNDLADSKFVDIVVENPSNAGSEEDEQMTRCMAEIERLQKDIERRKKKILKGEAGLSEPDKRKVSERNSRSRSRSRTMRDRKRNRSRSRESSPSAGSSGRLSKRRNHQHDRKGRSRSRSRSPRHRHRSSSVHKNLTFLEELERTFAEKGQSFPEKDLLLNQNAMHSGPNPMMHTNVNEQHIPMAMDYGHVAPFNQGSQQPNFQLPLVSYPIQQQHMYYGMNPMAVMAGNNPPLGGNRPPIPVQFPVQPNPAQHEPNPTQHDIEHVQMFQQTNEPVHVANQNALIERCEHAMKLVRARDNKVPVLKFLFNRSSTIVANSSDPIKKTVNKSPLQIHSPLNVAFKLNAQPNVRVKKVDGIRMLPKRVKGVCTALSIDSIIMFDKLRTKEVSNQITDHLIKTETTDAHHADVLVQARTIPTVETSETSTQTKVFDCEKCTERRKRVMVNVHSQITPKTFNIGIQTDEKDYREPIVEQLSQMTAAQLVAIRDFADIITEPKPQMQVEMYRIRERLMDIYNLSQRDADAVRIEEQRMAELQRIAEERRFGEGSSMRSRSACDMYPDMNMNRNSPPMRPNGGNFDSNDVNDSRGFRMDDRGIQQQRFSEERQYQNRVSMVEEQRLLEEQRMIERERLLEIERIRIQQREQEMLECEQRLEKEIRMRQMAALQQQQQQQQQQLPQPLMVPFDDDTRDYNRGGDDRVNFNPGPRGGAANNRRGRGAFRDNSWARGNRR